MNKLEELKSLETISKDSFILLIDDGSKDETWKIISELSNKNDSFRGIRLSRNRGHQNALLCGLLEARTQVDVTISIDCDGQDDVDAMNEMMRAYFAGNEIVYGVRSNRKTDSLFKRFSAQFFYLLMEKMGIESIFNHADYRLISARVLDALSKFKEVNLFLRGMMPLVGFTSTCIYYERHERIAGKSHYPLKKRCFLLQLMELPAYPLNLLG